MNDSFWKRITSDLARIGKKRTLLYALALTLGLFGIVVLFSATTVSRGSMSRWAVDLIAGSCVGLALLLRIWAERF